MERVFQLRHLTGLSWTYTQRMWITPIERLVMWFNRPKRCKQCRAQLPVRGDFCSTECQISHMSDWAI
jgi:hypothetical protein